MQAWQPGSYQLPMIEVIEYANCIAAALPVTGERMRAASLKAAVKAGKMACATADEIIWRIINADMLGL